VVRLSALRTSHLNPPGNIPGTHFCKGLSQSQGHSAAGRIVAMKNSNDTIGNRTCDLPVNVSQRHNVACTVGFYQAVVYKLISSLRIYNNSQIRIRSTYIQVCFGGHHHHQQGRQLHGTRTSMILGVRHNQLCVGGVAK
jgi:hypothetical protein